MTTIAYDGRTLAADKRFSSGNGIFVVTKLFRVNDCILGLAGTSALCLEMVEWFRAGAKPEALPEAQRDSEKSAGMLVIRPNGVVHKYECGPYPMVMEGRQHAMGSGGDFARAAMYLGKSAAEAVLVAANFDSGTGNGVDTLELHGQA